MEEVLGDVEGPMIPGSEGRNAKNPTPVCLTHWTVYIRPLYSYKYKFTSPLRLSLSYRPRATYPSSLRIVRKSYATIGRLRTSSHLRVSTFPHHHIVD